MGWGARRVWRWILPHWQARHPRDQSVMSLDNPRHKNLDEIIQWEVSVLDFGRPSTVEVGNTEHTFTFDTILKIGPDSLL
jgi:hypothetical protein